MIALFLSLAATAAAPAQAEPPSALVVPPAPPRPADPARLAAAERLLEQVHIERQYDSIFAHMLPVMTVQLFSSLKTNAQLPAAVRTRLAEPATSAAGERIFAEESAKGFKARYPEMRAATAREYAALFTTEELDQITAFYRSAVGQKTLSLQPALQTKLMPIGMRAGAAVGAEAIRRTFERLNLEPPKPTT